MTPQEQKFTESLNIFKNDLESFCKFIYTEITIHAVASKDKKILDALNHNPLFWNTVLSSLQHASFISLGRIFRSGRHNIKSLLKNVKANRVIFMKACFERRWLTEKAGTDISSYIKTVYEITDKDITDLETFIDELQDFYGKNYDRPRNHFGHRIYTTNSEIEAVFSKVKIDELEKFYVKLKNLYDSLWQLYYNGRPLSLNKRRRYSTRTIVKKGKKSFSETPFNVQVIKETENLLKLIK
jgi:hypothetical protein